MNDHTRQEVKGHPLWILEPKAWSQSNPVGYQLKGPGVPEFPAETLQFVDGKSTVTVKWWEQARLYYRSIE